MIASLLGSGVCAGIGMSARAMTNEEGAEQQALFMQNHAQAHSLPSEWFRNFEQYRPHVDVPAWYQEWSREMSSVPVCNP